MIELLLCSTFNALEISESPLSAISNNRLERLGLSCPTRPETDPPETIDFKSARWKLVEATESTSKSPSAPTLAMTEPGYSTSIDRASSPEPTSTRSTNVVLTMLRDLLRYHRHPRM